MTERIAQFIREKLKEDDALQTAENCFEAATLLQLLVRMSFPRARADVIYYRDKGTKLKLHAALEFQEEGNPPWIANTVKAALFPKHIGPKSTAPSPAFSQMHK